MDRSPPTLGRRPAVLPKPSFRVGNANTVPPPLPGSPLSLAKRSNYTHLPPSSKTPPRSPVGLSKFPHGGEKARLVIETPPPLPTAVVDRFGLCLQSAREQINTRHQGELQVLEGFRNYMHRRAKADGEYVAALAKIHSQAAREVPGVGTDSSIGKVGVQFVALKHAST